VNDNAVTVNVNPQVSNVQRYESITQAETTYKVPVIAVRNIQTELSLSDGQIIMIGGLYSNKETDTEERVPFLSDLPFIGEIFTGKNQSQELTQLIFFLKINILTPEEIAEGVIYDPGKQAETLQKVGDVIKNSKQIFPDRDETSIERIKKEFIDDAVGSKKLREAVDEAEDDNKTNKTNKTN
jgi:type II secretory pathway component GspD/PulD (secretin)